MIARRRVLLLAGATAFAPEVFAQDQTMASVTPTGLPDEPLRHLPTILRTDFPATLGVRVTSHGQTIMDYRRDGVASDELFRIYSITKSVLAILTGIALDAGSLASLDQPVVSFFPEIDLSGVDPRSRRVTIRHILTMTCGWDTMQHAGGPPAVTMSGLRRPMVTDPGAIFSYDNNATNMLGILLERAVGEPLDVFAARVLFRPLGIETHLWRKTPDGFAAASGGLSLSIAALTRFGAFIMQGGVWKDQRLVSKAYMAEMLSRRVVVNAPEGLDYGYLWFVQKTPDGRHDGFIAQGFGGQVLHVVPDLNLVVATTTEPRERVTTHFIRATILPAMRG